MKREGFEERNKLLNISLKRQRHKINYFPHSFHL